MGKKPNKTEKEGAAATPAKYGIETLSIHAGARPEPVTGARNTPIYQTTSYVIEAAEHAADLVAGLKRVADFEISVAAYPETHPEAKSADSDLDNLKRKIDAGAERAITQYFFEVDDYLRFVDRARGCGITVPIVPGILPVGNFAQVVKFSAMCGTTVPRWMADLFEGLDDDPETRRLVAATVAAEQCRRLQANGVDEFHFYTLNRADLAYAISHVLGLRPDGAAGAGDAAGAAEGRA